GWDENKNSSNPAYSAGDTLELSSNKTVYAIWRKKLTLTYNANGGNGAPATATGYVYNSETEFEFTISDTKPTRTGYLFGGWSLLKSDVVGPYAAGGKITVSSDSTLYATWMEITSMVFTVSYQANGGSGVPKNQSKNGGEDLTLSDVIPTREGYTFIGWGTSSTATEAAYSPGSIYSKDSNIVLYALWEKKLTLSYQGNGGNNVPASQSETVYNEKTSYTFTISDTIPVRSGYTFVGWGTTTDATSTYGSGEQITITEDKTLYAIWSQDSASTERVTLTYSGENGGKNIPASRTVDKDRDVKLSGLLPFKEGYDFLGWSLEKDATSASYAPEDEIRVSSDITLYAIWKKSIVLSYDGNKGESVPFSEKGTIYNKATIYTFKISYDIPVREGYIFLGWNENKNDQAAFYAPGDEIDLSDNKILYAIWKEDKDNNPDSPTTEESSSTETKPVTKLAQTITAANKTLAINSKPVYLGAKTNGNGKLTYKSSNTKVATISSAGRITVKGYGTTKITITAAGTVTYNKTVKTVSITVVPKKMKLKSVKSPKKGQLQIVWVKDKAANGYQIQFSRDLDFKKGVYQKAVSSKLSKLKKPVTGLISKKRYYVRIRSYKKVSGKKLYGIWSYGKVVKIK
ncbi:MAG: InlB B-repeat-containing protein, partial [Eubacterium sp.]|nr:InlB B-repeat-containing protein [Eubacterium sp.]